MCSNDPILNMDMPKSDNNNNAINIKIILHIDYDTDNIISMNRYRTPIRYYTFRPRSTISLNAVNIKSDCLIIKQSRHFSRLQLT